MRRADLIFRPEARVDIREVAFWYEGQRPGLGDQFIEDLNNLLMRIAENPLQFPKVDRRVHRALLQKFPYEVYFRLSGESARIIAVLHQRRHPDTWRRR